MVALETKDGVIYRANCGCSSTECGLVLELEYDPEINDVSLNMYQKLFYCSWFGIDINSKLFWLKDMWYRFKGAIKLIHTGRIELEEAFLLNDEKQIDDFVFALQEGRRKIMETNAITCPSCNKRMKMFGVDGSGGTKYCCDDCHETTTIVK